MWIYLMMILFLLKVINTNKNVIIDYSHYNSVPLINLAYKYKDELFSFVHKLYHDNYIDYKAFTFNSYNQIIFGKHIEQIPFKYKGQFNIDNSYSHWGANITGINYRGYHYDFNTHFIVHAANDQMIVSTEFFNFMIKEIFADAIELNNCVIEKTFNEKHLNCYNVGIEGFSNITLQISKMRIVLKREDLFVKKLLWESKFMLNNYNNYTILGYDFIHLMNQTVFDYEKGTITFYSNNIIIEMDSTNKTVIKCIMFLNIVLCLCINVLLIYIKLFYK